MRKNFPVTDAEYPVTDETLIVSRTDLKGRLTYVNEDFIDAAEFTTDELIGKAYNIVRHPDMPPEAFENLWASSQVLSAAQTLSRDSARLTTEVNKFLNPMRMA